MGASGSSSKRKNSKRKSSKISSEAQRKKKNRRIKSKKLRRRNDSISSYSDDDSRSSVAVSSSGSEDGYRKARPRTRSDVKSSKKRAQRSCSRRQSSEDSRPVKKRKGSKRNNNSEVRKTSKKKRPRKNASISSISSSTCQGGSSSSGESEFGRPRGRSREQRYKRDSTKASGGTKSNKIRFRSCSSCSRCSHSSDYSSKEKLADKSSSRRLRSVVTVPKRSQDEEKEWDKDGLKEEIVYDYDDYPSCRSNDSTDWGSKRDLAHHSQVTFEKRTVESVKGEEALVSNTRTAELTESCKDGGGQDDQSNHCSDVVGANNPGMGNKSEVPATATANSDGDDLESILRQKALENLRKFRGGLQTNANTPVDHRNKSGSDVSQLSTAKAEFVQHKLPKEDGSRVVGVTKVVDQNARLTVMRDSSRSTIIDQKIPKGKYGGPDSGTARQSVVCLPADRLAHSGNLEEKDLSSVVDVNIQSEPARSASRQETSGTCSILKQATMSHAYAKSELVVTDSSVDNRAAETSENVDQTSNKHGIELNNVCESAAAEHSSCLKPAAEVHSSKERQDEAKEGSQFEQKTMSVMRGGERVQVSYKVYIPKKAPALARRQLRR
ncbi:hypothetical protein F0562_008960 [Nyssa sinensis]|uniref:Uncharacterized protein n=1 Tax=Nyssa sinensis TaxID=561372 RepID=A0A5J5AC10_9ASTE|nr:hypothetical protein F0562_008960 [Nyssa sinensis]